mgnify:CR=1 FL=1
MISFLYLPRPRQRAAIPQSRSGRGIGICCDPITQWFATASVKVQFYFFNAEGRRGLEGSIHCLVCLTAKSAKSFLGAL